MAHYYVPDEVQEIADYIGDSYYLSDMATKVDASVIVLCGVRFMGESAKILNPGKKYCSRICMPTARWLTWQRLKNRGSPERVPGCGCRMLCQFHRGIKKSFRRLCHILQCSKIVKNCRTTISSLSQTSILVPMWLSRCRRNISS